MQPLHVTTPGTYNAQGEETSCKHKEIFSLADFKGAWHDSYYHPKFVLKHNMILIPKFESHFYDLCGDTGSKNSPRSLGEIFTNLAWKSSPIFFPQTYSDFDAKNELYFLTYVVKLGQKIQVV